jgi:hypothetical protein
MFTPEKEVCMMRIVRCTERATGRQQPPGALTKSTELELIMATVNHTPVATFTVTLNADGTIQKAVAGEFQCQHGETVANALAELAVAIRREVRRDILPEVCFD